MTVLKNFQHPVIAAVREVNDVQEALASPVKTIYLMGGSILDIIEVTKQVQSCGKSIFLHVELLKGIGRDKAAIEFIAKKIRPEGVVSTKPQLLLAASKLDLQTVLQIFMIDSQAFETGMRNIRSLNPDIVEIMPGLVPGVATEIKKQINGIPLVTAGMIRRAEEVEIMLNAGCNAIAASNKNLWWYQRS